MATRTISVAGGNWNAVGTWLEGAVPTAADDVVATALSGNVTIPAAVTALARSVDFTGYLGTLTFAATTSVLTVGDASGGALKFVAGMTVTLTGLGTINLVSTTDNGGAGWGVTSAGKTLPNVTFNGAGGKWVLQDALTATGAAVTLTAGTLDTNGMSITAATFSSNNSNTRVLTLGATTMTLTGGTTAFVQNGANWTLNAGTSHIMFTGATAGLSTGSVLSTFYDVTFSGSGQANISPSPTFGVAFRNLTRTGTATKTDSLSLAGNVAADLFTATGNSVTNRLLVFSSTLGTARTITAAVVALTNADFMDIAGAGAAAPFTGTSLGDALGNSGITFDAPQTNYWVGGTGAWADVNKWANASGGVAGTGRVPLPQDNVVVDAASGGGTVTISEPRIGKDLTFVGFTGTLVSAGTTAMFGSLVFGSAMTVTVTGSWSWSGRGSHTITSNGKTFAGFIQLSGSVGGTYTLLDALSTTNTTVGTLRVQNGTLNANGYNVTAGGFLYSSGLAASIDMGSGTWSMTSPTTAAVWNVSTTGLSVVPGTAVIDIATVHTSTRTFAGRGLTYPTLRYTVANSPGALAVTGANTFAALDIGPGRTLTLPPSTTETVTTSLDLDGEDYGYLYLPGLAGSYVSTPDTASLDITGALDVRVLVNLDTIATQTLLSKWSDSTQRSWRLWFSGTTLAFDVSGDGAAAATLLANSGVHGIAAGTDIWIRATYLPSTYLRLFKSVDGINWTQLIEGSAGIPAALFANTKAVKVGAVNDTNVNPLIGKVRKAEVRDGIDGTVVADYDAAAHDPMSDTYTDSTGKVWTLLALARQGLGRVTLNSSTPGTKANLSMPTGSTRNVTYTQVVDSDADGTAAPFHAQWPSTLSNTTDWLVAVVGAMALEVDEAFGGALNLTALGGQATETDLAQLGSIVLTLLGQLATETDTAHSGGIGHNVAGSLATEVDAAFAGGILYLIFGEQAQEIDTALGGLASLFVRACMAAAANLVTLMTSTITDCEGNAMADDECWDVGDVARLSVALTNTATPPVPVAPTTITLTVRRPDGTEITPGVTNDGVGEYHYDLPITAAGQWRWRWESTGTAAAASEGAFLVQRQRVSV